MKKSQIELWNKINKKIPTKKEKFDNLCKFQLLGHENNSLFMEIENEKIFNNLKYLFI